MRTTPIRLRPLSDAECSEEQRELLGKGSRTSALNIFRTLVRHPELYRAFMRFGGYVLGANTLLARDRELVILRIGHLCDCAYEVHQHNAIARSIGFRETELSRIAVGPSAPEWSERERALLQAADDLHANQRISDPTWALLERELNEKQVIDLVFTAGQYTMVCMALRTFGVQVEAS